MDVDHAPPTPRNMEVPHHRREARTQRARTPPPRKDSNVETSCRAYLKPVARCWARTVLVWHACRNASTMRGAGCFKKPSIVNSTCSWLSVGVGRTVQRNRARDNRRVATASMVSPNFPPRAARTNSYNRQARPHSTTNSAGAGTCAAGKGTVVVAWPPRAKADRCARATFTKLVWCSMAAKHARTHCQQRTEHGGLGRKCQKRQSKHLKSKRQHLKSQRYCL